MLPTNHSTMKFDSIHFDIQVLSVMIPYESMFVQSQSFVNKGKGKRKEEKWKEKQCQRIWPRRNNQNGEKEEK